MRLLAAEEKGLYTYPIGGGGGVWGGGGGFFFFFFFFFFFLERGERGARFGFESTI